jgi:transcription initiation factor TFIID subunit TAF12
MSAAQRAALQLSGGTSTAADADAEMDDGSGDAPQHQQQQQQQQQQQRRRGRSSSVTSENSPDEEVHTSYTITAIIAITATAFNAAACNAINIDLSIHYKLHMG